jgi:hypothetical protein
VVFASGWFNVVVMFGAVVETPFAPTAGVAAVTVKTGG